MLILLALGGVEVFQKIQPRSEEAHLVRHHKRGIFLSGCSGKRWFRSGRRNGGESPPTSRMNSAYSPQPMRFLASVVVGAPTCMPCCAASKTQEAWRGHLAAGLGSSRL
jgi:hypothetical protein